MDYTINTDFNRNEEKIYSDKNGAMYSILLDDGNEQKTLTMPLSCNKMDQSYDIQHVIFTVLATCMFRELESTSIDER